MQPRRQTDRLGIYVHFPYCIQKCAYCDFYSVGLDRLPGHEHSAENSSRQPNLKNKGSRTITAVNQQLLDDFQRALVQEWQARLKDFRKVHLPEFKVDSIFFGGGTASLMPASMIAKFLQLFRSELEFVPQVEITLEGNPENFTPDYLQSLAQVGINRVNAGLQTFQASFLSSMNRYYDAERYASLLNDLCTAPIPARGVDLIYGFAGQNLAQFQSDLETVLAYSINHLSVYSLTVEQATPYATAVQRGQSQAPNEDLQWEIYRQLPVWLAEAGMAQYEISNFAKPDYACRHNLRYWYYEPCLALGPGAHGFDGLQRYANSRSIPHWSSNPAGADLQKAEPLLEFPLSYLRLSKDLRRADFHSALQEYCKTQELDHLLDGFLADWQSRHLITLKGTESSESFDWTMSGQSQLDNLILEMSTALESLVQPAVDARS